MLSFIVGVAVIVPLVVGIALVYASQQRLARRRRTEAMVLETTARATAKGMRQMDAKARLRFAQEAKARVTRGRNVHLLLVDTKSGTVKGGGFALPDGVKERLVATLQGGGGFLALRDVGITAYAISIDDVEGLVALLVSRHELSDAST
jgi:hypothetical protein